MCIAVVNKTSLISLETFKTMFENNPDGIGFSYADGKKVHIFKTLKDVDSLYKSYETERLRNKSTFLIHSRIKTHGATDLSNCHPFFITDKMSLIHNGMVDAPLILKGKSDTFHLVEFLKSLKTPENLFNPISIEAAWLSTLSEGSKVCILHADGRYAIFGESLGHWAGDNWFSNKSYEESTFTYCRYDSLEDYSDWISDTFISAYEKRNSILKYFGYKPLNMKITERIKLVDELCEEFELDMHSMYEDINLESYANL